MQRGEPAAAAKDKQVDVIITQVISGSGDLQYLEDLIKFKQEQALTKGLKAQKTHVVLIVSDRKRQAEKRNLERRIEVCRSMLASGDFDCAVHVLSDTAWKAVKLKGGVPKQKN